MVGVTRYSGECAVCPHEEEPEITAALLARRGVFALSKEYVEFSVRDLRQHERQCLGAKRPTRGEPHD